MSEPETGPPGGPGPGFDETLERRRVVAMVALQLLFAKYHAGLADASERVTEREMVILRDLEACGLDAQGFEVMLSGGHVVIDDPALYERWVSSGSVERLSSHHRDVDKKQYPDYGMTGPLVRECLHGRTAQGTWIQWEHTPTDYKFGKALHFRDLVHIKDFFVYRATHKNVGPWGLSGSTEKRPLYLQPRVAVSRSLPPEVVAGFVSALQAPAASAGAKADPVRDLFKPAPFSGLAVKVWGPRGRRTGALGGVPLPVHRLPGPTLAVLKDKQSPERPEFAGADKGSH